MPQLRVLCTQRSRPSTEFGCMDHESVSVVSVVEVYELAAEVGKEFERIMDQYGHDCLGGLMPKVITILEHLEAQAVKHEQESSAIDDLQAKIKKLERERVEKAEYRARFEKELETTEETWAQESRELGALVCKLQQENARLSAALSKFDRSPQSPPPLPGMDSILVEELQHRVKEERDRAHQQELLIQDLQLRIEGLQSQVESAQNGARELRRRLRAAKDQSVHLVEERTDYQVQVGNLTKEIYVLKQQLGLAEKENRDLARSQEEEKDCENDPRKPRFSTEELKEILQERNDLKARVSELEDQLRYYQSQNREVVEETSKESEGERKEELAENGEAPVQGPMPPEPADAPWKKQDSGIRKLCVLFKWLLRIVLGPVLSWANRA
ncbi:unnamed protein product [Darwinula stevensoni]|uniref:RILP-like protein 1 n=1 Tax=Darwinula stevensoni TaxID=69355 RepID=A0A7R9A9T6_9CRUS|nr:unnamed protein product [Darwinula stevensoni]CAG0897721.1 unnamed protein product [Darwinula stevensoni]